MDNKKDKFEVLKSVWGYDEFRGVQGEIIDKVLGGEDVLALLPTGYGKAMLYQLPALILDGTALVVSPLLALQEDQVQGLKDRGVRAELFNSTQGVREKRRIKKALEAGEIDLLLAAPETLVNEGVMEYLTDNVNISYIAFDEAHCLSQYSDFRPKYAQVGKLRSQFKCPVIAVTATADDQTVEDIKRVLSFGSTKFKYNEFKVNLDRPSINYHILTKSKAPMVQLLNLLSERDPEETGVIFCTTRKEVENVAAELYRKRYNAKAYHAGMSAGARSDVLSDWLEGDVKIIVCTIAFGLGIDKKDVRYVIHYNVPSSIEGYIQECGRASRDGLPSDAYLMFSTSDVVKLRWMINKTTINQDAINKKVKKLNQMSSLAMSKTCIRKQLLEYFGQSYPKKNCGSCSNCITSVAL